MVVLLTHCAACSHPATHKCQICGNILCGSHLECPDCETDNETVPLDPPIERSRTVARQQVLHDEAYID